MKRFIKRYWHTVLPVLLYIPYLILFGAVIVPWLGCACPRIVDGQMIYSSFNANHFTRVFWPGVCVLCAAFSLLKARGLVTAWRKLLYIVCCTGVSALLSFAMYILTPMVK